MPLISYCSLFFLFPNFLFSPGINSSPQLQPYISLSKNISGDIFNLPPLHSWCELKPTDGLGTQK